MELSKEQIEAINSTSNYILLIAGPGSGKTTVLTQRIIHLIKELKIPEDKIHAFTFTKKATREMSKRINQELKFGNKVSISNFHSYTYSTLNDVFKTNTKVVSEAHKKEVIKNLLIDRKIDNLKVNQVIKQISRIKNKLPIEIKELNRRLLLIDIYYAYEDYLKNNNMIDYDGMNLQFLNELKANPWFKEEVQNEIDYVLVDEVQDINRIQYDILKILTEKSKHLFMVGDPNQSIYAFRGSDVSILNDFIKQYPVEVLHLKENHRSTKTLVKASNNLIKNNYNKFFIPLISTREEGIPIVYKNISYSNTAARYISEIIKKDVEDGLYKYEDYLIEFRLNETRGIYDKVLSLYGIPHYLYGRGFLEYQEIKYILGYYRLIFNHNDNEAFMTIVNWPKRGIAETLTSKIREEAYKQNKSYYQASLNINNPLIESFIQIINELSFKREYLDNEELIEEIVKIIDVKKFSRGYSDYLRRIENISALKQMFETFVEEHNEPYENFLNVLAISPEQNEKDKCVKLMTIHQAKGLEAKVVFMVDLRDEIIPGLARGNNLEEERRVFYVGMTRAKERLYLIATEKNGNSSKHKNIPSRFISEIDK